MDRWLKKLINEHIYLFINFLTGWKFSHAIGITGPSRCYDENALVTESIYVYSEYKKIRYIQFGNVSKPIYCTENISKYRTFGDWKIGILLLSKSKS